MAQRLRLTVISDGNRNGQVDADEGELASGTFTGMLEPVLVTFDTPLEIPPVTTVHLVIILEVLPPAATTKARFPVFPHAAFGWGLALPIIAGLVLLPYRFRQPRRLTFGLFVLTLLCALALTNCGDDDDTLTFRLALPAHSVGAVGSVSGAFTAPDVTIVSPSIIVRP